MVTEIELKYSLLESEALSTPELVQKQISQLLSVNKLSFTHKEKQLSNYYFDTTNLALRRSRIALRTRGTKVANQEECFEQTIKTSGTVIAGLHQRPEYNVDINNATPKLALFPQQVWQADTDINQLQQDIIELFSTNFTRHTWLVNTADSVVEIAFDCGVVACQEHANKPRIYEVELELVSGDTQSLFVLTKLLFSQLMLRPGQLTKAARGYALYHEKSASIQGKSAVVNKAVKYEKSANKTVDSDKDIHIAFTEELSAALTQLQLAVDDYVDCNVENKKPINQVIDSLGLIGQSFSSFNEILTEDELVLETEAKHFNDLLLMDNNAQDTIKVLHSERFNNLQLDLLSCLLIRSDVDNK